MGGGYLYKVGGSMDSANTRQEHMQTGNPFPLIVVEDFNVNKWLPQWWKCCTCTRAVADWHYNGGGGTEWYYVWNTQYVISRNAIQNAINGRPQCWVGSSDPETNMTNWPFLIRLETYYNMLVRLSWAHWIGNQMKMRTVEIRKHIFLTGCSI